MPKLSAALTLQELLDALAPAWTLANKTDPTGAFLRPDYRAALADAWEDIVVAAAVKGNAPEALANLNVAMARNGATCR